MLKTTARNCGVLIGVAAAGLIATGCDQVSQLLVSDIPPELEEKRVLSGQDFLSKELFKELPSGTIWGLSHVELGDPTRELIGVSVYRGLYVIDPDTRAMETILADFEHCTFPELIDVEPDGIPEFLCPGGGFSDVALLDNEGTTIWERSGSGFFEPGGATGYMGAGDLDGDGDLEFCAATTIGLRCLEDDGTQLFVRGRGNWYDEVHILPPLIDGSQDVRIIASRESDDDAAHDEDLELRGATGNLIESNPSPMDIYEFDVVLWPEDGVGYRIVGREDSTIFVADLDGRIVFEHVFPSRRWTGADKPQAVIVQFAPHEEPHIAILVRLFRMWKRSVLSVFTLDGALVYQEILDDTTGLLSIQLPDDDLPGEVLLVGDGPGHIAMYSRVPD